MTHFGEQVLSNKQKLSIWDLAGCRKNSCYYASVCACASEVYNSVCVCVCVCVSRQIAAQGSMKCKYRLQVRYLCSRVIARFAY